MHRKSPHLRFRYIPEENPKPQKHIFKVRLVEKLIRDSGQCSLSCPCGIPPLVPGIPLVLADFGTCSPQTPRKTEVFLHLRDIDDTAFCQFLELGIVDVAAVHCRLRLHVVTDWSAGEPFAITDRVVGAIDGLDGETFDSVSILTTYTNHDHEELVESIEEFGVRYLR